MFRTKVVTVVVLAAVFTWSTVMIVLGHAAAAAVLLSSLGLIVQQIVQALTTAEDPARPDGTGTGARDGQEAAP